MEIKGTGESYQDIIGSELGGEPLGRRARLSVEYFVSGEDLTLLRLTTEANGRRYTWTREQNENPREPNGKLELTLEEADGIPSLNVFEDRDYYGAFKDTDEASGKIKVEEM